MKAEIRQANGFCDFKTSIPRGEWMFGADNSSRKMASPEYGAGQQGIPKGPERAIRRCPKCGKRLYLRAGYCVGGEFVTWLLPDHKPREIRKKSAKRQTKYQGRGR